VFRNRIKKLERAFGKLGGARLIGGIYLASHAIASYVCYPTNCRGACQGLSGAESEDQGC
jgi:hypothetical protein